MMLMLRVRSAISIHAAVTTMLPRNTTAPEMWRKMCHLYGYNGRETANKVSQRQSFRQVPGRVDDILR